MPRVGRSEWYKLVEMMMVRVGDQYRCVLRPVTQRTRSGNPVWDILRRAHLEDYINATVINTSYRFLYQCMHTFLTSPPDMFGFWVVRRPLLDARLTALRPYSTKKLLRRVQKEYPSLLQSREGYKQDTEEGSDLRVTLFQEVIRRVQKEMRGGSREKNSRREEGWTEKGLDVGCE
ncbi:hypothetical protein O3P69_007387 [Scylla paramamosain]|uniref:Uncharacterized protein n=1 Tax=Scylla paramamosain TaxID=85552 RepID=A0AAW0V757_SCYPA